jgi:hypothetical protein
MRKITLLVAFLLFATAGKAQIAPGSAAPDFTVTDINGTTHHLADYLAAGKTVIMDISATWCNPCWNYHNNHTLEDIYYSYGPGGSDEVVVLFVEGDPTTGIDDLYGETAESQGNWVEGSVYPIIDAAEIGDLYEITYFPTIFRICPDGIVTEVGSVTAGTLRTGINNNCGVTLQGVQNNAHAKANENRFCAATGAAVGKVRNLGENPWSSITADLLEDGNVIATKTFTGTTNRFVTKNLTFDSQVFDDSKSYDIRVTSVNDSPLYTEEHNTATMGIQVADYALTDVTVKVFTDNYPTEITWEIRNSANQVVASGGPYVGSVNGGGADANTVKTHAVTLDPNDCHSVRFKDAYGDGWSLGNTAHGMQIVSDGQTIFDYSVGNFGTTLNVAGAANTTLLAVENPEAPKFGIYPNPTTGIFNIATDVSVKVTVVNMLGKTVYAADNVTSQTSIDLSGLQKGVYIAKIESANASTTEKVILK